MTVAAHGGDIYQNQITYDFSVNTNPLPLPEILQKRMAEAAVHSNSMTMCCCGNGLQHFMVFQQKK